MQGNVMAIRRACGQAVTGLCRLPSTGRSRCWSGGKDLLSQADRWAATTLKTLVISCFHFPGLIRQRGSMSDVTIPGGKIRSFVERIENLDAELQELNEQKKEVFSEAKGEGFDVKILKEIVKLRKQDQDEREERESLIDLYMRAMETAPADKVAKAA
jgi:uncharacterized protein (UPF0335 family)